MLYYMCSRLVLNIFLPVHSMDDIELKNIQLQIPSARRFNGEDGCTETRVRTDRGDILVAVQGDRAKPAIITYHDLGLNCEYLSYNKKGIHERLNHGPILILAHYHY